MYLDTSVKRFGVFMNDSEPTLPYINHEYDGRKLVMDLCNVPDHSALTVATFFEDAAKKLRERHKVYEYQQAQKRKQNSHTAQLQRLPIDMIDLLLRDYDYEQIMHHMADKKGFPRETVNHYWLRVVKELENQHKAQRDSKIIEMALNGQSDERISKAVNLSDRQVRRIIQKYKKAALSKRP